MQHQGRGNRHRVPRVLRAVFHVRLRGAQQLALHVAQGVSLFRNRIGSHLQGRRREVRLQPVPVLREGRTCLHTSRQGGDHLTVRAAVRPQGDHQGEGIKRLVDPVDNLVVKGFRRDDAPVCEARVQQALLQPRDESAEDIARAEVHPNRRLQRLLPHCRAVVFREPDPVFFPFLLIDESFIRQMHRHGESPFHSCRAAGRASFILSHLPHCFAILSQARIEHHLFFCSP